MFLLFFVTAAGMLVCGLIGGYLIWGGQKNFDDTDIVEKVVGNAVVDHSPPTTLYGVLRRRGFSVLKNRSYSALARRKQEESPGDDQ